MKKLLNILLASLLLSSCSSSPQEQKDAVRDAIAEANGSMMMWDGIVTNISKPHIECKETFFHRRSYWANPPYTENFHTFDCDKFLHQLTECIAAEGEESVKQACFRHKWATRQ